MEFTLERPIPDAAEKTRALLIGHYEAYPRLRPEDIFKFLYQSAFGCEHMVTSLEAVIRYIKDEASRLQAVGQVTVEPLDGGYSRVHLAVLDGGLRAETLGRLFFLSAVREENGYERLMEKLTIATALVREGRLPLDAEAYKVSLAAWRDAGYGALHHSPTFREAYRPAYRVTSNEFADLLPLFTVLDRHMSEVGSPVFLELHGCTAIQHKAIWAVLEKVYGDRVLPSSPQGTRELLSIDISCL